MNLGDALRKQRSEMGLSQQQLAAKVRMGQRQISDLERRAVDSRLSTLEHVALALDLQLMLVPRPLVPAVKLLISGDDPKKPMFSLDEEDEEEEIKSSTRNGARLLSKRSWTERRVTMKRVNALRDA